MAIFQIFHRSPSVIFRMFPDLPDLPSTSRIRPRMSDWCTQLYNNLTSYVADYVHHHFEKYNEKVDASMKHMNDLEKKFNILEERVNALILEKCYMQMYIDDLHKEKGEPFVLPTVDQLKRFSPSMGDDCPPPPKIRRGGKKSKSLESVEECPTPAPVCPVTTAIVPTATYTTAIVPTAVVTPVISYPRTTCAYVEECPTSAPVRKSKPFVPTI